ncbi:hypothetical protein [uncultured Tateyamaria sp.]|uniref:hypothetical protein n=1 Tax=uncultured Tateyamaria sp. TaxID=455651 RepID=UPI00263A0A2A|nr:hypothetical protein [uncultured Tateyamaria sp.]
MLIAALVVNLVILVPVIAGLVRGRMDLAFGPDTDARRILLCLYCSIAVASAVLILLHVLGAAWAVPMTFALFAVQIMYKLATVVMVGLHSPVVATNLCVVVFQLSAILAWSGAGG